MQKIFTRVGIDRTSNVLRHFAIGDVKREILAISIFRIEHRPPFRTEILAISTKLTIESKEVASGQTISKRPNTALTESF